MTGPKLRVLADGCYGCGSSVVLCDALRSLGKNSPGCCTSCRHRTDPDYPTLRHMRLHLARVWLRAVVA